jgi:thioredoxin reductase
MSNACNVAIIGSGPYGLSLAAHLRARGLDFRIFGKLLDTWRCHMPKNMLLKSEGFASNLSAPDASSTFKAYCAARGHAYADRGIPIPLDNFLAYGGSFHRRFVGTLEHTHVTLLRRDAEDFILTLENGEEAKARNVVLAAGVTWFAYTPEILSALPAGTVSHSFQHRDVDRFRGREVAVIGAGASAIDLAVLLQDSGASVCIVARNTELRYHFPPDPDSGKLLQQIQRPISSIGPGWRSYFCATAPLMFYRLPERIRARATQSQLHPAGGWFMRERVEGRIPTMLGCQLTKAEVKNGRVVLTLGGANGEEPLACDHVIAATGYRPDLRRLPFLASNLRASITEVENSHFLTDNFETSVRGLFALGPVTTSSFGPVMRFMVGAEFAAPRLASHLERKLAAKYRRAA